ncbi:MAG TPA: hypothetical protein VEC11_10830 [Allosphingosinicella sp.]|nr:hypothetical protein [Allosphingosinicella sp.]
MTTFLPFLASLAAAMQPAEQAPNVTHGIFYAQENGRPEISETNVIPLRTGQCYGWALRVEPEQRSVTIREVFELPAPGNWNVGNQMSAVARNARTAVTEFEAPLGEGLITHGWCVAEGDPAGPHRIRVYHGETLLHDFRFTVRADSH